MSSDRISDVSSVISADWQSDDEPHVEAVGDLIPLAIHRGKVVLTNQILKLGGMVEDLDDLASVSVRVLQIRDFSLTDAARTSLLRQLDDITPWHTTIKELAASHPEAAEAVRFMTVGSVGVLNKKVGWSLPAEKLDFNSLESKRLQHYRTRFANLQTEPSTRAAIQQFIAHGVEPFAAISLDSAHARQKISSTSALITSVRKTKIWQIANEKSRITMRVWPVEKGNIMKYEALTEQPFEDHVMNVEQITNRTLKYLATHMTLGEVLRLEWNDEPPAFPNFGDVYLQLVQFENSTLYECLSDRSLSNVLPHNVDCLWEVESSQLSADSENICRLDTILSINCEDTWEKMRATGIRSIDAGALTVIKLGDDYLAFVMQRTRVLPLWFHSLIAKMKCNYQYTISLKQDMRLLDDEVPARGIFDDKCLETVRRQMRYLEGSDASEPSSPCADESSLPEHASLSDSAYEPFHKPFAALENTSPISVRLDRVYKLHIPASLAEFNSKGTIAHFETLTNDYHLKANEIYEVTCLGEISGELNGNSGDLPFCLANCVGLVSQAELHYESRPAFFATLSGHAELYIHSVLARILEPYELTSLQNFCSRSGIQTDFPPVAEESIPKIELFAQNMHNFLTSLNLYLNALRMKLQHDQEPGVAPGKNIISTMTSAREAAASCCPRLARQCHLRIVEMLLKSEDYKKCLEYCASWGQAVPELDELASKARKLHVADEAKSRSMYKKMFR